MKRKFIFTQDQFEFLIENYIGEQQVKAPANVNFGYRTSPSDATQTTSRVNGKEVQTNPVSKTDVDNYGAPATPIDEHSLNTILSLGASLIPVVGPFLSVAITLYDAKKYQEEGDPKSAAVNAFLALLPGAGKIASKIPMIKTLGESGMKTLAGKLASGVKQFTPSENMVLNGIKNNYDLVKTELNNTIKTIASKNITKNPEFKKIAGLGLEYGKNTAKQKVAGVAYDIISKN